MSRAALVGEPVPRSPFHGLSPFPSLTSAQREESAARELLALNQPGMKYSQGPNDWGIQAAGQSRAGRASYLFTGNCVQRTKGEFACNHPQ